LKKEIKMLFKTILIEDEPNSVEALTTLIKNYSSNLEIIGTAASVEEAVTLITLQKPQLVFMDVRIADGNGFDVLRKLSAINFELIFVTAYDSYAMEAIKFSAVDYLMKPVGILEFEEAIVRVIKRMEEKSQHRNIETLLFNLAQQNNNDKKISIPTSSGYEFINMKEVIWCGSDGPYTAFYLSTKQKIVSTRHLGFYEGLLTDKNFCRINHSIIINMLHIKRYVKGKGGHVVMNDETELEISQRRKSDFLDKLAL
jgi:two-component system, LytTR family, response regulator